MKKMVKFGSRKRFDEGGEVEEGERAKEYVASKGDVAPSTFREAFAQARKEGKDRFYFNGKSYTTEIAGSKPKSPPSTPAKPTEPAIGGRETAEENLAKRRPTDLASSKARHEGMKIAGERSQRESDAEKARESRLGSSILARDRLGNEPDAYIVNRRRRAAMEEAKESAPSSRTFGAGAASAKGLGSIGELKKGGKVHKYAKGGSVGSASKRADGIAMRGKTRGKMV